MYIWRAEVKVLCLPPEFSASLRWSLPLSPKHADLGSMAASPRNPVSPPKDWIMGKSHTCPAFVWVPGIQKPGHGFCSRCFIYRIKS